MRHRYYVTTWDTDKGCFTPQKGVRTGPYSLWGLRKAIRKLRDLGYPADKSDNSTLIERDDRGWDEECIARWNAAVEEANAES